MEKIRVMLVDDSELVRENLRYFLKGEPDIEVIAEASNGIEAISQARKFLPHIILMDLQMLKMNGLEAAAQIKKEFPEIRIIALTINIADEYLSKTVSLSEILKVIKKTFRAERSGEIRQGIIRKNGGAKKGNSDLENGILPLEVADVREKFELYQIQQQRILELSTLVEIGKILASSHEIEGILSKAKDIVLRYCQTESLHLSLWNSKNQELESKLASGLSSSFLKEFAKNWDKSLEWLSYKDNKTIDFHNIARAKNNLSKEILRKEGIKSCLIIPLTTKGKTLGVLGIYKKVYTRFSTEQIEILKTITSQTAVAIENALLYNDLEELFIDTITSLARAIDARDTYTLGHSEGVSSYAVKLAEELGLPPKKIDTIKIAGILHDIGKIGICDKILFKKGFLTKKERQIIQTHPKIGAEIIGSISALKEAVKAILGHHEYYNGKGYPLGLKGEEISLEARILAIADAFDAMISKRAYREAFSTQEALEELKKCAGTQFDPNLVNAFFKVIASKENTLTKN